MVRRTADVAAKERLSRDRIVDCALALADAEGLDAVTIRRLATDQGVTPMALYWHFKDKDLLLDGLVERLLSQVVLTERVADLAEPPWDERLRELLDAILVVLRAHPALAPLVQTRFMRSEPGLDITERALRLFGEAGFGLEQSTQLSVHALASIVLLVAGEPGRNTGLDDAAHEQDLRSKTAVLKALSPQRYPSIVACADAFIGCMNERAYFELGLDVFLAGIRAVAPKTLP